jgi:chromosome segregation ATPase
MSDDEFAELVESMNSPTAKRIAELEREIADLREQIAILRSDEKRLMQFAKTYRLRADEAEAKLEQERQDRKQAESDICRALGERNEARAIIDATLKALPVGYIPAHTQESLPGRVGDLVSELGRMTAMIDANDDMRDLLREIYNLTQIGPGHHPQMPARALELIAILIEDKTPPP